MIRVALLGDTLLGGEAQPTLDRFGAAYALEGLAPITAGADLVVANHEGPLTLADRPIDKLDTGRKRYWYRGLPETAYAMADAGIKVVSLANNHVLDFGPQGLFDTLDALDAAGIAHCGAGANQAEARKPAVVSVNGVRLGFLSFMQRYDLYAQERLYASAGRAGPCRLRAATANSDLRALGEIADVRIALVPWGRNYRAVTARQRRLGRILRDAGADLVIGHHPHVPQPVEIAGGVPVLYSLGNGPLGTPGRFHGGRLPYGLVPVVEIDGSRVSRVDLACIAVDNADVDFRPEPERTPEATRLLWSLVSRDDRWVESAAGTLTLSLPTPRGWGSAGGSLGVHARPP